MGDAAFGVEPDPEGFAALDGIGGGDAGSALHHVRRPRAFRVGGFPHRLAAHPIDEARAVGVSALGIEADAGNVGFHLLAIVAARLLHHAHLG